MTASRARIKLLPRTPLQVSARPGGAGLALKPYVRALNVYFATLLRGPKGDTGSSLAAYPAAVALSGHVAVTLDAAGQAILADCRTPVHAATVLGVTTGAAESGAPATVQRTGTLVSPGWGLTPDAPVYLGEAGALVQTVPPSSAFVKPLGRALSATTVLIELQPAIFLN